MKPNQELADTQWHKRAHYFEIRILSAHLNDFYGTEDHYSSFSSPTKVETKDYHSSKLRLIGRIEAFTPSESFRASAPELTGSYVSFDLDICDLKKRPDGLFDYGCIGLGEVDGKIMHTHSCLRMSNEQFLEFLRKLPLYFLALQGGDTIWTIRTAGLSYEQFPEVVPNNGSIWRFGCVQFEFLLRLA